MTTIAGVTVLVADDEPLARRRLVRLIESARQTWVGRIVEAPNGLEARRAIDEEAPGLVFLDIRMPGLSGLEVLRRTENRPLIVFTTAFERHAVEAFQLEALDYLVKPFGRDRLRQSLDRARLALTARRDGSTEPSLERIFVRRGSKIEALPTEAIVRFEACDDYVRCHTGSGAYLARLRLADLERRLDSLHFLRIHRSHIVNLRFVTGFRLLPGSRYAVQLEGGEEITASRARSREIRRRTV